MDGPEPVSQEHSATHDELAGVGPSGEAEENAFEQAVTGSVQGGRLGLHAG
jgi:hypothetical protein